MYEYNWACLPVDLACTYANMTNITLSLTRAIVAGDAFKFGLSTTLLLIAHHACLVSMRDEAFRMLSIIV